MIKIFGGDPQKKENIKKIKEIKKLIKKKDYNIALKVSTQYLNSVPDNPDVLFIVGSIYYMKNRHKAALPYFERALQIGRYDPEVLLLKGRCHKFLGDTKKANDCWQDILEVDPRNDEARRELNL
ncbi:MAG: tetratricopeptide repeat protein [Cenarchaeum sp. SB0661_bin_35]|nr:tetratricopeptide repeat protein [Cenarchaeum sp. SB0667_bin_13]MYC79511.1 tetratricopeptide repeat protein [Cenarchaeum sp. SB0661_bin_35]MYG33256.1 tetratricopeptide repeat protein [Cenarchaeum sp. SB0677_bin_16]MYI52044.1 tetratricopeptide repeat protein [Cenarchaeum sp. SB0673_bin_9]